MIANFVKLDGKNQPRFEKPVLIFEQKGVTPYIGIAVLKSIDADGYHWGSPKVDIELKETHVWGQISDYSKVNPTHWCDINTSTKLTR